MSTNKTMGLMRQNQMLPITTADQVKTPKDKPARQHTTGNLNQQANIKTSMRTKDELELLQRFTNQKYTYEVIETLIDYYVENAMDADQRRSFNDLRTLFGR